MPPKSARVVDSHRTRACSGLLRAIPRKGYGVKSVAKNIPAATTTLRKMAQIQSHGRKRRKFSRTMTRTPSKVRIVKISLSRGTAKWTASNVRVRKIVRMPAVNRMNDLYWMKFLLIRFFFKPSYSCNVPIISSGLSALLYGNADASNNFT